MIENLTYNDLAIIIAWPDATMRGDENWMMFFKKIGLVKNLNFRVGHTAIILVDPETKRLLYYDFGRYISPRGYGRARSVLSDPRLRLHTKAKIDRNNQICNLYEIMEEMDSIKEITQGVGRIYFSVAEGLSFIKAKKYADDLVKEGSMLYGAVARGNNNCSRFVTRLLASSSKKYGLFHGIRYPETIKSSPMSNVVNVRRDRLVYLYDDLNGLKRIRMSRFQSIAFLLQQLYDNVSTRRALSLPDDTIIGAMEASKRPTSLPEEAQWLGGVGEGAWYLIKPNGLAGHFVVSRYTETGELEYERIFRTESPFDINQSFAITYDSHLLFTTIIQGNNIIRLHALTDDQTAEEYLPVESEDHKLKRSG
ncbi:hypothetical protein H8S90_06870 [Olivibacter sp. SDN3]|uniref:DUF6695 family protein n=1 Tax=Olivibacter sp. SDN3 TaxID=2764720 RepID=UPI001651AEB6|nr:DUF6695 family protein [Olivibacter sp. SDN3]QNL51291.1 hypothetical protein H8S90_06870 [Olivibacter sp. SDN3]